jgi:hypothetical protein
MSDTSLVVKLTPVKNKQDKRLTIFSVQLPKVRDIVKEEIFNIVRTRQKTVEKGGNFKLLLLRRKNQQNS